MGHLITVLRMTKGLSHCLGALASPSLTLGRNANEEDGEGATGTSLAHGALGKTLLSSGYARVKHKSRHQNSQGWLYMEIKKWGGRWGDTGCRSLLTQEGVTVRLMITSQGMQEPSKDLPGDLASMNS